MTALSFDDVLLVPQTGSIASRFNIGLQQQFADFTFDLPIIGSPMDSVYSPELARQLYIAGGMAVVHRYNTPAERTALVKQYDYVGAAVGMKEPMRVTQQLIDAGARFIVLDTANGHNQHVIDFVAKFKAEYPTVHLMAGNVATPAGFVALEEAGADSIRVGIGGGSACTTRIQTGFGVPTLQSIMDVAAAYRRLSNHFERKAIIIADGGIRTSGDIVKALAFGADFVMLGKVLAHAEEAPAGEFRGMASKDAKEAFNGNTGFVEGATIGALTRRPLRAILTELREGILSGVSYAGAHDLAGLRKNVEYVQISPAGLRESFPHGALN